MNPQSTEATATEAMGLHVFNSGPIYARRRAGQGHYNATKDEWKAAWREARRYLGYGLAPNPKSTGIHWKAQMIVFHDRKRIDRLTIGIQGRLAAKRAMDELISALA